MKNITENLKILNHSFQLALKNAHDIIQLEEVRVQFLGRKGTITELMHHLKNLSVQEKQLYGPLLNAFKQESQEAFNKKIEDVVHANNTAIYNKNSHFDVTAYLFNPLQGSLHLYTLITQELEDIFMGMGYHLADGPEIENDYYNFSALNIPQDHPARDMHDTFWIQDFGNTLLRTHTSTVQIHIMEKNSLPLAVFAPGRVYRNEATDASHNFMFMQGECLYIDKNVSMAQLLGTAQLFLKTLFGKDDLKIRVRPGYFPFVEPGIEIDAACPFCTKGCSTCKQSTWIELLGAGLVHPNVLRACNIDPTQYRGFAMGFGITRLAMIKYGINDVRLLNSNKISFLKQFNRFM